MSYETQSFKSAIFEALHRLFVELLKGLCGVYTFVSIWLIFQQKSFSIIVTTIVFLVFGLSAWIAFAIYAYRDTKKYPGGSGKQVALYIIVAGALISATGLCFPVPILIITSSIVNAIFFLFFFILGMKHSFQQSREDLLGA